MDRPASSADAMELDDEPRDGATDFVWWTWKMVNSGSAHISWSSDGRQVVVSNPERLGSQVLPNYFRRSQYSSWVRALNAYGFRKQLGRAGAAWEHKDFRRGRPDLLKLISRQKAAKPAPKAAPARAVASTSTTLVRAPRPAVAALLAEERNKLWWMRSELERLEQAVAAMRREDFQQRFDTVRVAQAVLAQAGPGAGTDALRLTFGAPKPAAREPLRLTHKGEEDAEILDLSVLTLGEGAVQQPVEAPVEVLGDGSTLAPDALLLEPAAGFTDDALRATVNYYFAALAMAAGSLAPSTPQWGPQHEAAVLDASA
jgi:hypothetical protein